MSARPSATLREQSSPAPEARVRVPSPGRDPAVIGPGWPPVLAALSLGAALVHAAATTQHSGNPTLLALFATIALVQGAWALAALHTADRRLLWAGLAVNGLAVVAYVVSRSAGLPGIEGREAVGARDLLCVALELGLVASCAYLLGPRSFLASYRDLTLRSTAGCLAVLVALTGLALHARDNHTHSHATSGASAAGAGHDHGAQLAADHPAHGLTGADHAGHQITPSNGPKVDPQALIAATRAAAVRWRDPRVAIADGYSNIGDWPFEHFVNWAYVAAAGTLDPRHPESLVYVNDATGRLHLVSVMYIAPWGTSFDDVPNVADAPWHTHPNLCWDGQMREIGAVPAGSSTCTHGTNVVLPPMLHVWVVPNGCGPFAELEDSIPVARHFVFGTPLPTQLPASECSHAHAGHTHPAG